MTSRPTHDGALPLQPDAVDPPEDAHHHEPTEEPRQRHQETEAGPQVGAEYEVHAAAQHEHGDDDDGDPADLGLPPDGEDAGQAHHRLRMYSTSSASCASV